MFGRIIDALAGPRQPGDRQRWPIVGTLVAAWVGIGVLGIAIGVTVALHADRLSHRRRQAVLTDYFEHVMQLPLSFHGTVAFRPADEGDALRHRRAVDDVARFLPRLFRRRGPADRAPTDVLVPQLAAGPDPDRRVRRVRGADLASSSARPRRCSKTSSVTTPTLPNAPPMRSATSPWCRGSPGSRRRFPACATWSTDCWPRRCRSCRGGRWCACSPARRRPLDAARDLHRRHLAAFRRPRDDRRHRHVHEPRGADRSASSIASCASSTACSWKRRG